MPPIGKHRSNYRVKADGTCRAKGYGGICYDVVRIEWDSDDASDASGATVEFNVAPVSHEGLQALIAGLNSGRIPDRWDSST